MADLDRKNMDIRKENELSEEDYFGTGSYHEETSAELAAPLSFNKREVRE